MDCLCHPTGTSKVLPPGKWFRVLPTPRPSFLSSELSVFKDLPCNTTDDHQRAVAKRLNRRLQTQTQVLWVKEASRLDRFTGSEALRFPGECDFLIFQEEPEIQIFMLNILIFKCWQLINLKLVAVATKQKKRESCIHPIHDLWRQPSKWGWRQMFES